MSFTVFSAVLLTVIAITIYASILKGRKRGLVQASVQLGLTLLAALITAIPSKLLFDYPIEMLADLLIDKIPAIGKYSVELPSLPMLLTAALDALATPVIFVILFPIVMGLLRMILAIVYKIFRIGKSKDLNRIGSYDTAFPGETPSYVNADAPWYVHYDRLLGGIVGALCGFFTLLLVLSPIVGTLSSASAVYRFATEGEMNLTKTGLNDKTIQNIEPYINDSVVATLDAVGGNLVYDALATSTLEYEVYVKEGEETVKLQKKLNFSLHKELNECLDLTGEMISVMKSFSGSNGFSAAQAKSLGDLGHRINQSGAVRVVAADFVKGACTAWLSDETYFSLSAPKLGGFMDPVMNSIYATFALASPDCIGNDLETMMNVYCIMLDRGLTQEMSQDELNALLEDDAFFEEIFAELNKNSCMAFVDEALMDQALSLMMNAIDLADLSNAEYSKFVNRLFGSLEGVIGLDGMDMTQQVQRMSEDAIRYAKSMGISLPSSMTEMAMTSVIQQLGTKDNLDVRDLENLLSEALNRNNTGGEAQ